jgi:hypothetical protein
MTPRAFVALALLAAPLLACESEEALPTPIVFSGDKSKSKGKSSPSAAPKADAKPPVEPATEAPSASASAAPEPSAAAAPPKADGTLQLEGAPGDAIAFKPAEQVWNNYRIKMKIAEGYVVGENMGHPTVTAQDRSAAMILVFDVNALMPSREMILNASRVSVESFELEPEVPVHVGANRAEGRLREGTGLLYKRQARVWALWFETPGRYTGAHAIVAVTAGSPRSRVDEVAAMLRSIAAL